ncbi:MAG: HAMP domain-containing sensor histidine kinase [Candidatus Limnocylindrales bacterium]
MSIRARLTWAYGVGVAATLALVGVLVWWQMSDSLVRTLEMALQTRSNGVLSSIENQGQPGLQEADNAAPGIWVALFDSAGVMADASSDAPATVPVAPGPFSAGGHQYLLRVDAAQDGTVVVTGADLAPVAAAQGDLARILFGVGLSVGVASLVVGWILAGRALRPVDGLIAAATALGPGDLDQRLAPPQRIDEVGRLTMTLNGMLDRISESVSRQRLFVAMASHELRTPLAALRAELDLADRDGATASDYRAAIRDAHADAVRLTTLTTSLLDLAAVDDEANQSVRTRVSVRAVAASAVRATAPLVEQMHARLIVDVPDTTVWIDRTRVERALVNMLANSIIHSTGQPEVELRADVSPPTPSELLLPGPRRAHVLRLSVVDRGPGFGADDPAALFEPLRRGTGVHVPGSGLGLAMVAATARAHGGSFGAANRDGGGGIVWLEIPASPGEAGDAPFPAPAIASARSGQG